MLLTEELLVFSLKAADARFELIPPSDMHLGLLLTLSETINSLADECLTLSQLPAHGDDVVMTERGNAFVVFNGVQLRQDVTKLLVFL